MITNFNQNDDEYQCKMQEYRQTSNLINRYSHSSRVIAIQIQINQTWSYQIYKQIRCDSTHDKIIEISEIASSRSFKS